MCQELQIFAVVYMYSGAGCLVRLCGIIIIIIIIIVIIIIKLGPTTAVVKCVIESSV